MKRLLNSLFVFTLLLTLGMKCFAQDGLAPNAVINRALPEFTHIKIIDTTQSSPWYNMLGYPGIWIKQTDDKQANITYNNVCTPYISTEVIGDTLVMKMDQSFLYPRVTTWNPAYGMISAIEINVPHSFGLESVYNNGTYQYNTTIMNFDCKSFTITSSNSFRIQNCKIKKLYWNQIPGMPIADGCQYSLRFKLSSIGVVSIAESGLPAFSMGDNIGTKIKKFECRK